jgi:hypothetical protein
VTLAELASRLHEVSDDLTIYVKHGPRADGSSEVVLVLEPEDATEGDGSPDGPPPGFDYLLEVDLAKEVVEVWSAWRNGRTPTPEQAAQAIAYYAVNDAPEPLPGWE